MSLSLQHIFEWLPPGSHCVRGKAWHSPVTRFAADSREVVPGSVFICLRGKRHDGHHFLEEAYRRGAIAAMVAHDFMAPSCDLTLFRVSCVQDAFQEAARRHVATLPCHIMGITGSLGKTTVKEFTHTLLSGARRAMATLGNQNSQVGLALSLLNHLDGSCAHAVLEMAMTEAGQIRTLTGIAPPDVALITRIALVHAENFSGIEAIAKAKAEIFSHPKTSMVLLNRASPCSRLLQAEAGGRAQTFSMSQDREATWTLKPLPHAVIVSERGTPRTLEGVAFPAPHVYECLLASIALARSVGLSWQEIEERLPHLRLPPKRLEVVVQGGITFVDDSYNASELSIQAAMDFCARYHCTGRRIAVIGGVLELGPYSSACHRRLGEYAVGRIDELFCLGEVTCPMVQVWEESGRTVFWYRDYDELLSAVGRHLQPRDLVLIKGSRATGLQHMLQDMMRGWHAAPVS